MKLEDQVLSIEQVQELQELGFNIEKYASMCWVTYTSDEEPYEKKYNLSILDEFCYESASLEPTPTMSIGDIIEVLPQRITMNNTGYILKTLHKFDISYTDCAGRKLNAFNLSLETLNLIDALFETLKWCIKQKHIVL